MANDIGPKIGIDGEAEFRSSISAINAQMKSLAAEMKAVTAEFASNAKSEEALTARNEVLGRSVEAAKSKLNTLDGQLDRQKGKLDELAQELERAAAEYGENSTQAAAAQNAYNRQYRIVADLESQYQRTREQLADFERQMRDAGDAADDANDRLNSQDVLAGAAGWDLIKTAVNGVTQALRESISVGMAFDASISDIAATMGTTVDQIGNLRDFARDMGATTVFTATQAGQALDYMALAGYDAEKSMVALPNVLNLAASGGLELATASDMVTDAQTALGLSMEETARLVDEMAKTSTRSNTSVAQLGEAILTVGGTAKFMAGGTKELNQVVGALADNSIKGAEGGTKLRNIILSLASPTEKAAKQLKELKVDIFDADGAMRQFSEFFPEMQRALANLTDQQQIEALGEIFNTRDIAAVQALLGTTVERWDELATAIDGAAGSAEHMAKTRLDNLAGDITLLQSAADGARIAFSDSLTPALRDSAQMGTGLLTVIGGAVDEMPLLGHAAAGLTAAGVTLGAGMVASAAGITSVTGAVGGLTAALATNPFGLAALAVGGLVTAFSAVSYAAEQAKDANDELRESLEATMESLDSSMETAAQSADHLNGMAEALIGLAESESRSELQTQSMLSMIEQLNREVPGLNLAYDEQTGKVNMTADAIRDLTAAEADRVRNQDVIKTYNDLLAQQADMEEKAAQAEKNWKAAMAETNAARELVKNGLASEKEHVAELEHELSEAIDEYNSTVKQLNTVNEAIATLEEKYGDVAVGADEAAESIQDSVSAVQDAGISMADLSTEIASLETATLSAAGAAETMSNALKEQEKEGSLSLETTKELIDAGYEAAIAIDQETGAVTLNRAEYVKLAGAKIQEQLATLEAQKASLKAAAALEVEKNAAFNAGSAYWEAAKQKAVMATAGDAQALDLQIAALKRAQSALGSYGTATATTARKSSGASKKIKSQAERDLEDYKALKATLDHEQNMGLLQDEEYYRKLGELRDRYLGDEANLSEYRKASETIYKAQQKAAESALKEEEKALQEREKAWQTAGQNILKLEDEFQQEMASRAQEIMNSYKLFDAVPERQKVTAQELLKNLQEQNKAVEGFYANLDVLAERGVDASLVDSIRSMGVGAKDQLQALVSSSDELLTKYAEEFGRKQDFANQQAGKELEALRELTNEEILGQLEDVSELYDTNAPALGLAFAQSLADGMFEGMPVVESMAQSVASAAMSAFERTYNRDVEAMMTASRFPSVTRDDIGELLAGAVNGINTGGGGSTPQPANITIVTKDKLEIARAFIPDIRTASNESPETMDDT